MDREDLLRQIRELEDGGYRNFERITPEMCLEEIQLIHTLLMNEKAQQEEKRLVKCMEIMTRHILFNIYSHIDRSNLSDEGEGLVEILRCVLTESFRK